MPDKTIFYCWMNERPPVTNRNFIETVLKKAIKDIADDITIDEDPRMEKDTQGLAGSPDISSSIFDKIGKASAVVCDVSLVNREGKPSPNPNVMVELGYAVGVLGWEKVLMVMNSAYSPIEDLPFDIRQHTVITYKLEINDVEKETTKKQLRGQLKSAISSCLNLGSPQLHGDLKPIVDLQDGLTTMSGADGNFILPNVINVGSDVALDVKGFIASRELDADEWIEFDISPNLPQGEVKKHLKIKYSDSLFFQQKLDNVMMLLVCTDIDEAVHVHGRRIIQEARDDGRFNLKQTGKVVDQKTVFKTIKECMAPAQIERNFGNKSEFSMRNITKAKIKRAIRNNKKIDIGVMIPYIYLRGEIDEIDDAEITYSLRELEQDGYLEPYNGYSHDTSVMLTAKGRRWVYDED